QIFMDTNARYKNGSSQADNSEEDSNPSLEENSKSDNLSNPTRMQYFLNILNCYANYVNSLIGAGIVALPITLKLGGIPFSVAASIFCCVLIYFTSDILVRTSEYLEKKKKGDPQSYAEVAILTIGPWSQYIITILIFLMMFFAMSIYLIILRRSTKSLIEDFTNKVFIYDKLVLLAIVVPVFLLCIPRDITILGYTSMLSSALVVTFLVIIIVKSPEYNKLMNDLTPNKMMQNELKLNIERMQWLCEKVTDGKSIYSDENDKRFRIHRATNIAIMYNTMRSAFDDCTNVDVNKLLPRLANIAVPPVVEHPTVPLIYPVPRTFVEVVGQAHAQSLFVLYSLIGAVPYKSTLFDKLGVLGIYFSAFIIQQAQYSIINAMLKRNLKNWRIVQTLGMPTVYILCMAVAFSGYYGQRDLIGETVFDKMRLRYFVNTGEVDYGFIKNSSCKCGSDCTVRHHNADFSDDAFLRKTKHSYNDNDSDIEKNKKEV
ncbi:hypothetical protein MHBO_000876, partial [Bonamia ostreae]